MAKEEVNINALSAPKKIKDIVNTPFKKAMFIVQLISYVLIVGSPVIGGAIGSILNLNAKKIGVLIFAIFIIGEVLFYGSLFFLGKELILIIKEKAKGWFKRKKQNNVL